MRTYIYGVPQGFDFYEKDVQFTDYLWGTERSVNESVG